MKTVYAVISGLFLCLSVSMHAQTTPDTTSGVFAMVLGTVQDAGAPQLACDKECCTGLSNAEKEMLMVSCLAIYDTQDSSCYLLDATPDIAGQMSLFNQKTGWHKPIADAIFLTHAHIGHYTGLMYLGREAAGTRLLPVYVMPRMKIFLQTNGPWSMLDSLHYISLKDLRADRSIVLSDRIRITPIEVPHRDEFSETVGFRVDGPYKSLVYIPDIDKWNRWERDIKEVIADVDIAFLDGTFYDSDELPGRDMSEIPHPFIQESMQQFADLDTGDKKKVHFIHLNHTNPALKQDSPAQNQIFQQGYHIAKAGQICPL